MLLLHIGVAVLFLYIVIGKRRTRKNSGAVRQVANMSGLSPTGITGIAEVMGAAQRGISAQRSCRIEITSVKRVTPKQSGDGATAYVIDAMLMNTCTTAHTFERLHVMLAPDGNVHVHSSTPVTPVPGVSVRARSSAAISILDTISNDGVAQTDERVLTDGYAIEPLLTSEGADPRAYPLPPHGDVRTYATAPTDIHDNLDYTILREMNTEPLQDLTNTLAHEKSALAIQYT